MEPLWERTKHAFEKILSEGEKAAERMSESIGEFSDVAKARLEKARLERALFKQAAELGNAVYERSKGHAVEGCETDASLLEDPDIKRLIGEVAHFDEELIKVESRLSTQYPKA